MLAYSADFQHFLRIPAFGVGQEEKQHYLRIEEDQSHPMIHEEFSYSRVDLLFQTEVEGELLVIGHLDEAASSRSLVNPLGVENDQLKHQQPEDREPAELLDAKQN